MTEDDRRRDDGRQAAEDCEVGSRHREVRRDNSEVRGLNTEDFLVAIDY